MSTEAYDQNVSEFPRFLSRDDGAAIVTEQPPPFPRRAWPFVSAVSSASRRMFVVLAAIGVPALASAAFLAVSHNGTTRQRFVTLIAVPPPVAPPDTTSAEIASAVEIVAKLEARLGYASNLSGRVQDFKMDGSDASENAMDDTDSLAALPVFGTQPAPVAENIWSEVAKNPDASVLTPAEEIDVAAPVEALRTREAAAISALNLDLGHTSTRRNAKKELANTSDDDAEVDPGPRRRTHTRKTRAVVTQSADGDEPEKRPVRRHKVAKMKYTDVPQGADSPDNSAVAVGENDTPKGPVAKFFTWLKGKQSPPAVDENTTRTGLGMTPQN